MQQLAAENHYSRKQIRSLAKSRDLGWGGFPAEVCRKNRDALKLRAKCNRMVPVNPVRVILIRPRVRVPSLREEIDVGVRKSGSRNHVRAKLLAGRKECRSEVEAKTNFISSNLRSGSSAIASKET